MKLFTTCQAATEHCKTTHTFAVAHLYSDDASMKMHIHDTYEIYYSISGGKQFLIWRRAPTSGFCSPSIRNISRSAAPS